MAAGKGGGGVMGFIKKALMWLLIAGIVLAVLKLFNYDPFGIVEWIWNWIVTIVTSIADFLTGKKGFREIFTAPSIIVFK